MCLALRDDSARSGPERGARVVVGGSGGGAGDATLIVREGIEALRGEASKSEALSLPRVMLGTTLIHYSRVPTGLRAIRLAVAVSVGTAAVACRCASASLRRRQPRAACTRVHNGAATHDHAAHLAALVAQGSGQACHQEHPASAALPGTCPTEVPRRRCGPTCRSGYVPHPVPEF